MSLANALWHAPFHEREQMLRSADYGELEHAATVYPVKPRSPELDPAGELGRAIDAELYRRDSGGTRGEND